MSLSCTKQGYVETDLGDINYVKVLTITIQTLMQFVLYNLRTIIIFDDNYF